MFSENYLILLQVRRLVAENGWLREELANTQTKLCDAEQRATKAEEERAHYKFMAELNATCGESDTRSEVSDTSQSMSGMADNNSNTPLSPSYNEPISADSGQSGQGYEIPTRLRTLHNLVIQVQYII
jgi:hypothetical protein